MIKKVTDNQHPTKETPLSQQKELSDFAPFAVKNMSDGVYLISKDARIVYVNPAACKQLGYTEKELLGMRIMDIDPHVTEENWKSIRGVTVRDKIQLIETEHRTKEGRLIPVEVLANYVELDGEQYSCTFARDISERKAAEQKIHESERRLALASSIAHVGHWERKVQTGDLIWTDEVYRIFGYEPGEIVPSLEMFINHINPEDRKRVQKAIEASVSKPIPYNVEFRYRCKDGMECIGRATGGAEFDRDGRSILISGALQDITEIRRIEESLIEREVHYHALFNAITDMLFVHKIQKDGTAGNFIEVNNIACERLGYTRQELLALSPLDIDAPDSSLDIKPFGRRVLAGERVIFEQTHIAKDGQRLAVEIHAQMLKLGSHPVVLSLVRDITERKQAEEALKESEEKYRLVVENASDAIFIVQDGTIKFPNRTTILLSGYSEEELTSVPFLTYIHDDDKDLVIEIHRETTPGTRGSCHIFFQDNKEIRRNRLG